MEIAESDLIDLLKVFSKKAFDASTMEPGSLDAVTVNNCEYLMKLDYSVIDLDNTGGIHSSRYPPRIFIPEYEHGHDTSASSNSNVLNSSLENGNSPKGDSKSVKSSPTKRNTAKANSGSPNRAMVSPPLELQQATADNDILNISFGSDSDCSTTSSFVSIPAKPPRPHTQMQRTIYEDLYDVSKIREFITYAQYARCRQRFVVPVILFRGKLICRSGTISVLHETYSRYAYDCITSSSGTDTQQRPNYDENSEASEDSSLTIDPKVQFSYSEVIRSDVSLLNTLNVNTIADLMVEKRKVKYFMTVSSSEKADPANHYDNFNILSLPYPGCEFFKKFRDNNYMANDLQYNWELPFNDANISIPKIGPAMDLDINWEDYQKWDLVEITQNYLKAMLKYLQEENSGLLVHCISGWDRTPLFISLIRISLWADGLIHQSLDHMQITYFTLAYDWYLFGHQLPDREKRGEDIMLFCFHMLKFISSEEYSLVEHRKRTKTTSSSGSVNPVLVKPDDDAALREDLLAAAADHDSNDSYSNPSNCDMAATENSPYSSPTQTTTNNTALTSRSPNPKRLRTSPISVPGGRQRKESSSSNGSWNMVTDTGSLDSIVTGSYMRNFVAQREGSCDGGDVLPTTTEGIETNSELATSGETMPNRKRLPTQREINLNAVRATFIRAYGKGVGLKFREGSSMTIGKLIGTLF
ncbi:myotubularin-related protein 14 [Anastrepha ludens]|uniref:myotubularin-related protein 14 n=1 Tax=Anastrepha ludens TaxID=28586 RepID=UPI0023AF79AB|nr:myotubularin-related protein 14 [Anastrepha ludens]